MKALDELVNGLLQTTFVHSTDKFDAWVNLVKNKPVFSFKPEGFLAVIRRCDCILSFEEFEADPVAIETFIGLWLLDHYKTPAGEEVTEPKYTPIPLDNGMYDVTVDLTLSEEVYLKEDDNGDFEFSGKRYALGKPEHKGAENIGLAYV